MTKFENDYKTTGYSIGYSKVSDLMLDETVVLLQVINGLPVSVVKPDNKIFLTDKNFNAYMEEAYGFSKAQIKKMTDLFSYVGVIEAKNITLFLKQDIANYVKTK